MRKLAWSLLIFVAVGFMVAWVTPPAAAAEYTSVAGLESWSAATRYMSLPGYLRWMTFQEQGVWLSMAESKRIVAEQLAQQ